MVVVVLVLVLLLFCMVMVLMLVVVDWVKLKVGVFVMKSLDISKDSWVSLYCMLCFFGFVELCVEIVVFGVCFLCFVVGCVRWE